MYQRSADMALGVPFNIVGYSWLLMVMSQITGLKPGVFNHFLHDVHIYENHLEGVHTMLSRNEMELPKIWINPDIKTLEDLETWVTVDDFKIEGYNSHPAISLPMAV
jgi:thymidylate synthase